MAACSTPSSWLVDVNDRKGSKCSKPAQPVEFRVLSVTSSSITVNVTDAGAARGLYSNVRYQFVKGGATLAAGTASKGSVLVLNGLDAFASHAIAIESQTDGGKCSV